MFHKLHVQLTIFCTVITGIILLTVSGIFLFFCKNLQNMCNLYTPFYAYKGEGT